MNLRLTWPGREQRLDRGVAGREHVLARQAEPLLGEVPEVRLELLARLRVGLGHVDHGRPADLLGRHVVAAAAVAAYSRSMSKCSCITSNWEYGSAMYG